MQHNYSLVPAWAGFGQAGPADVYKAYVLHYVYRVSVLVFMLWLSGLSAQAQAPSLLWQKALGGPSTDEAYAITATGDGGLVVAGYTSSTAGDVTGNRGGGDVWVAKLDAQGTLLWQKTLGGTGFETANAITTTTDGGLLVAGATQSNDGDVAGNHGSSDYWVVKLDAQGNLLWQKTLGGTASDVANAITTTSDGGLVVAGTTQSTDGDVTGYRGGTGTDYWVIKLDAQGNLLWQKTLGGSRTDRCYAITATGDGGLVVAGTTQSTDGDVTGNRGGGDVWVVKLDAQGGLLWQKTLGGSRSDGAQAITAMGDGGLVIAGVTNSNDGDVTNAQGNFDYWVVKLDAQGNLLWQKTLGGTNTDEAYGLTATGDGGVAVTGFSNSTDGDITGNRGGYDYWVVRLDAQGNLLWQKTLGGSSYDDPRAITTTTDGGVVVAGATQSNDGDVTGFHGSYDLWVAKLLAAPPCGSVVYVTPDGAGSQDGSSWANAFAGTALQTAINTAAGCGAQVWVAQGTYKPTTSGDRNISFAMREGVAIYGGFVGGEATLIERNPASYTTVLSGDIGTVSNAVDNSYHVIANPSGLTQAAVLDGFVITGGNANGPGTATLGGGMYNDNTSPVVANCSFVNNQALDGGGMYNQRSSPVLINCLITNNTANTGGGMGNNVSSPTLTNCVFLTNSALANGGAMINRFGSNPALTNCSLLYNVNGGGIWSQQSNPGLTNCVLFGNGGNTFLNLESSPTLQYCLLEPAVTGYTSGSGNLTTTAFPFISATDLRLKPCSPAVNAGDNAAYTTANGGVPPSPATDLAGSPRLFNNVIDMGAYEYQGYPITVTVSSPVVSTATVGQAFNEAFTATGGTEPYNFNVVSSNLPASLSLSSTGFLSGTPTEVGSYTLLVQAGDANGCVGVASTAFSLMVGAAVVRSPIRYVRQDGTGTGNSWADASGDLQSQINLAGAQQVWVAQGTYKPTTTTDRSISFAMREGVAIYGGFVGSETMLTERNPTSYTTVLSGDIGEAGTSADNSYHVINNPEGLTQAAVLDGFVITAGNADNSTGINSFGGGLLNRGSSPSMRNCIFQANTATLGGGVYSQDGSPALTNCSFVSNVGLIQGGGMAYNGSPLLTNCSFRNNSASFGTFGAGGGILTGGTGVLTNCSFVNNSAGYGGGIHNQGGSPTLINCSFVANSANYGGVLSININGNPTLINCTFAYNTATNTAGVVDNLGSGITTLLNCVLFGNGGSRSFRNGGNGGTLTVRNSLFEVGVTGYTDGGNNRTTGTSPFISTTDPRLTPCSPAINAGDNAAYTTANGPDTDGAGNPRFFNNGVIDMGAFEYQGNPTPLTVSNPGVGTATVGAAFSQPFTVSGGVAPYSFSVAGSNLPASLSLLASGILSGTPTEAGSYTLLVQAGDANGCVGTGEVYTLTVQPLSLSASLTASPTQLLTTGTTTLSATVTGGTSPYSYVFSGAGVISQSSTSNTATIAGLSAGVQTFTVTVTDATAPTSQTVTGTVSVTVSEPVADGPVCDTYTTRTTANGLGNNTVLGVYAVGNVVYAATGGGGLSISTDGGSSFTTRTTASGLGNSVVLGVYAEGSVVYAATNGGLSISTDGGQSFTNRSTANGLGNNAVRGVYAVGSTIYAATFGGGLSISTDGGSSFTTRTTANGLGNNIVNGVYAVGSVVYAATQSGLSISTDGGSSFANSGLGANIMYGVYVVGNVVYVATNGGLSISTDGGSSFTNRTTANGLGSNIVSGVYALGNVVYAATNGGLSISTDGGQSFTTRTKVSGLGSNDLRGVYALGNRVYAATFGGGLSFCPIPSPPLVLSNFTASPVTLLTSATTSLSASVTGGTGPYSYVFSGPGVITPSGNTASVSGLSAGVQTFTVTVIDATTPTSQTVTGTVSVTVSEANTPPTVANVIAPQSATVDQAFSFAIPANTFADTETPTSLVLSVAGLPAGLSFTAPATISGTPSTTVGSPVSVTVTATDPGSLSVSTVFAITVSPAPVVVTSLSLVASASPTSLLTTSSTSLSAVVTGGTGPYNYVFSGPGTISQSSTSNTATVSGLSAGVQTFTVTVTDATAPTSQTVTGTVSVTVSEPVPDGPVCDTYTNRTTANGLGSNTVRGVYAVGSTIYAATTGGLGISTDGGSSFTTRTTDNGLGGNNVDVVYAVGSIVYATTGGGLSISTDGGSSFTNRTTANGLGDNQVTGAYVVGSVVYAATLGGLSISTDGGSSFTNKTTANGLASNAVNSVCVVGNTIYAATAGLGLSISTDGGSSFTTRTTANGLGNNIVFGVHAVGNVVYAATNGGLSISTDGGSNFINRTTANGLGNNAVISVYALDNRVYAATFGGLSFCPAPPAPASLVLSSFTASPTMLLTTASTSLSAVVTGGTTPYSYVFTGPGVITPSGNTASVSGLSAGVQTFTLTATDATAPTNQTVTGTVSVTVTTNTPTISDFQASPGVVCAGSLLSFTATLANLTGSYNYTLSNGNGTLIEASSSNSSFSQSLTASGSGSQSFTLTVSSNGQLSSATTSVTVNERPTASLVSSGTLSCAQNSVTLTGGGGTNYVFAGPGILSQTDDQALVNIAGTYSVTVTNANGCSATATTQVNSTTATLGVTNPDVNTALIGQAITLTFGASGGTSPYQFSLATGSLPPGLSLSESGALLGNPNAVGSFSLTVQATDATGCVGTGPTYTLTVLPLTLSASLTASPSQLLTNQSTTLTATATGGVAPFSYVFSGPGTIAPAGNTATVANLPTGVQTLSVLITDAASQTATASVSLTVSEANTPPTTSGIANQTATQGQPFSLPVAAAFADQETPNSLTLAVSGLPAGLSLVAGSISGSPSLTGVSNVTVVATDPGNLSVSTSFTLTVLPRSVEPTGPFAITAVTTITCTPVLPNRYSVSFTPRYSGLTGQPIAFRVVNELLPTNESGPYTIQLYTDNPRISLSAVQTATPDAATYVYDWLAACQASESANTPPRLVMAIPPQSATVGVGFSYVIPPGTFTDDQTPASLRLSAQGLPPGISLSGYTLSGVPSTTAGSPYSVTLTATDPGNLAVSTSVGLVVAPAPLEQPQPSQPFALTAVSMLTCTPIADRININFSPRYAGLNGQPIAFRVDNELTSTNEPGPYSLTLYRDNPVISLRATQTGSVGEASFAYNWLAACASQGQDNTAPVVVSPVTNQTLVAGTRVNLNLANVFLDQETPQGLTLTATGLPSGLALVGTSIQGVASSTGVSSVTVTARDPGGLSTSTGFTLTVTTPVSPTVGEPSSFTITGVQTLSCVVVSGGQRAVTFTPQYSGVDGQPITFAVVNERASTTDVGPYTLNLYTDNPSVTLSAQQGGTVVTYRYDWPAACTSSARLGSGEALSNLQVRVLGNPVTGAEVTVEVRGAQGQSLRLALVTEQGRLVSERNVASAEALETQRLPVGTQPAGLLLLRVSIPTQSQTVKVFKR